MMQHQLSTIEKISAYDNATVKSKYDVTYERQRVDRLQHELAKLNREANTSLSGTIQKLQEENDDLHRQMRDIVASQLQKSPTAATAPQPNSTVLETSYKEYKDYCKELELRMEEQVIQHVSTVELLQQQIAILQDSLQTTRSRLVTREAEMDRLSIEFEEYKRSYPPPLLSQHQQPHPHHHHHQQQQQQQHSSEFPISPLSMADSNVVEGEGRNQPHHFEDPDNPPHPDTIVTIPQPYNNNNINEDQNTTQKVAPNQVAVEWSSGRSVSSSSATTTSTLAHHHHRPRNSLTTLVSSSSSASHRPILIRSNVDRAKAMEQLEYERIHNAKIVQQLRQSVLLQQQQVHHHPSQN